MGVWFRKVLLFKGHFYIKGKYYSKLNTAVRLSRMLLIFIYFVNI